MELKEAKEKCNCPMCPSYVDCKERAFCFEEVGKSKYIKEEKGCLCPACPVQEKMDFSQVYYCTKGSNKKQSKK